MGSASPAQCPGTDAVFSFFPRFFLLMPFAGIMGPAPPTISTSATTRQPKLNKFVKPENFQDKFNNERKKYIEPKTTVRNAKIKAYVHMRSTPGTGTGWTTEKKERYILVNRTKSV